MGSKLGKEREVLREVLGLLRSLPGWLAWRNNTGGRLLPGKGGRGQFVRWGAPGSGDVFAVAPGGRFVSVECKRPGGKLSDAQADWRARVNAAGGLALVVTSAGELVDALRLAGLA